jgi:hypothetical protein
MDVSRSTRRRCSRSLTNEGRGEEAWLAGHSGHSATRAGSSRGSYSPDALAAAAASVEACSAFRKGSTPGAEGLSRISWINPAASPLWRASVNRAAAYKGVARAPQTPQT